MKPSYLTTLTPLRGIAALMMVVFHFNLMVLPVINPAITQLHRRWYLPYLYQLVVNPSRFP